MSLFVKKSISSLLAQAESSEKGLKKTLNAGNLVALGIGAIIGAGLFVRTAAAAGEHGDVRATSRAGGREDRGWLLRDDAGAHSRHAA